MTNEMLDVRVLAALEPISSLGPERLRELLDYCHVESVEEGMSPFTARGLQGQSVYLLQGELELVYEDGNRVLVGADSEWAKHPLGKRQPGIVSAVAMRDSRLLRIDDELLDTMVTWGQLMQQDGSGQAAGAKSAGKRMLNAGVFSVELLRNGPFAHLPPANIGVLLDRIDTVAAWAGDVIIREGDGDGDYYYIIEGGHVRVTRLVGGVHMLLSELGAGDAFGEEALVSGEKRNATVTMQTNGILMRVQRQDFIELLREPLLHRLSFAAAAEKVAQGATWMDVRHPSEYHHERLPGAINVPLNDIRNAIGALSKGRGYIVYCQSGRRSSAAAFILAQAGYDAYVLENGLWAASGPRQQ